MSFYKIEDLASAIRALSYTDMLAVSKHLAILKYRYMDFSRDHDFADLLTEWANDYGKKIDEPKE
jgi:hypothetical protein